MIGAFYIYSFMRIKENKVYGEINLLQDFF